MNTIEDINRRIAEAENDIKRAKAKLAAAEIAGDKELILMYGQQATESVKYVTTLENQITELTILLRDRESRLTSGLPAAESTEEIFYRTNAQIHNSKFRKGIRASVYQIAASHTAYYDIKEDQSIFYKGNDLHIRILFRTQDNWSAFLNKLYDHIMHFQFQTPLSFERCPEIVRVSSKPRVIFVQDYKGAVADPDDCNTTITHMSHISFVAPIDQTVEFQMVEASNLDDFYSLSCYKCYLRSPAVFNAEKNNTNNWLWMSWTLKLRFDGLNCGDPFYYVPQLAIRVGKNTDNAVMIEGGINRYRVNVTIECPHAEIFAIMKLRIKKGITVNETRQEINTWVFVQDPEDFARCLTFKYKETHEIWKRAEPGLVVDAAEASALRRRARMALTSTL